MVEPNEHEGDEPEHAGVPQQRGEEPSALGDESDQDEDENANLDEESPLGNLVESLGNVDNVQALVMLRINNCGVVLELLLVRVLHRVALSLALHFERQ